MQRRSNINHIHKSKQAHKQTSQHKHLSTLGRSEARTHTNKCTNKSTGRRIIQTKHTYAYTYYTDTLQLERKQSDTVATRVASPWASFIQFTDGARAQVTNGQPLPAIRTRCENNQHYAHPTNDFCHAWLTFLSSRRPWVFPVAPLLQFSQKKKKLLTWTYCCCPLIYTPLKHALPFHLSRSVVKAKYNFSLHTILFPSTFLLLHVPLFNNHPSFCCIVKETWMTVVCFYATGVALPFTLFITRSCSVASTKIHLSLHSFLTFLSRTCL